MAGNRWEKVKRWNIELVQGARDGFGEENTLLIDAGCVWDARTALRRAEAFNEYGIG